jgi:hypothetical protein
VKHLLVPAALTVTVLWGALGWYAFLATQRERNRLDLMREMGRKRLSETPAMVHATTWRPR